jgi:PAS domain S-box-containing protein
MTRCVTVSRPDPAQVSADAFRTIAELGGDVVFVIDCATGLPAYVSPGAADLLGYGIEDLRAQLTGEGSAGGPLAALCGGLAERLRRFAGGDGSRLRVVREFTVRRPDGTDVTVEAISTLMLDAAGQPELLAGLLRDLSARVTRERELMRFASMLNHEFRTPLSTIDGAIQRLEATAREIDDATRQRYRKIATATDRLIAMLDDYLSPERMAALGRERQDTTVSPRLLLEEVAAQARLAGRPAALRTEGLPASVRGNPAGLRLALKVLLDNALRYTPPGTGLALEGSGADGGIALTVADAGPGVPAADVGRIFDKGYRGTNAAGLPGSGLGLYMARSVVEVHGGTLEHLSSAPGGAAFRLWLPVQASKQ